MRAVDAAVRGDPQKLWVFIAVMEKFAQSAPVASRMTDELRSHGLQGEQRNKFPFIIYYIYSIFDLFFWRGGSSTAETRSSSQSSQQAITTKYVENHMPSPNSFSGVNIILSPAEEVLESEVYKIDFDEVKSKFAQLFQEITTIVEEAQVSLKDLKEFLTFYDMETPLLEADTIPKVMRVVQQESSFINCVYLKSVAEHFKLPAAKEKSLHTSTLLNSSVLNG